MAKIAQAAFRGSDGSVHGTGPFHNVDELPADFLIKDEGFIDAEGTFLTREEATAQLHLPHPCQSEELGLAKSLGEYSFDGPHQDGDNFVLNANHDTQGPVGKLVFAATAPENPDSEAHGYHAILGAEVHPDHRHEGLFERMLSLGTLFVKKALKSKGLMMANNEMQKSVSDASDDDHTSNENIEHEWQVEFNRWLKARKNGDHYKVEPAADIKKAVDELYNLAAKHGNLDDVASDAHHEVAHRMAGYTPETEPEFMAARFLAGGDSASDEAIRVALTLYDTDFEMAALRAYGLPRNEKYRDLLRNAIRMQKISGKQALEKGEMEVDAIPRKVEPATPSALKVVEAIRRSFANGLVHSVKLDGKHSRGTAIATDPESDKKWLIKPGSGKMSPAAGATEELANQSRREVAFYKFAKAAQLGDYFPEAELVLLDGEEVAVMELLETDYKGLDKLRQREGLNARTVFEPYRKNGDLFRWAVLDAVAANPDRHANNIMVDDDYEVKLIDHGSAFCGPSFDPANDTKSFVPYYLRAWMRSPWHSLAPQERLRQMPTPDHEVAGEVAAWIENLPLPELQEILATYGLTSSFVMNRLEALVSYGPEERVQALLAFWASGTW